MKTENDIATDLVAKQWQRVAELVADPAEAPYHFYQPLISLAASDLILGKLFPFVGVAGVCFSRCTDVPHYVDLGIAGRGLNDFVVFITDGHGSWADDWEIGRGDAAAAVRIARAFLPADYPPAIHGSRGDLRLENDPTTRKVRAARQLFG